MADSPRLYHARERTRSLRTTTSELFRTHRFNPDASGIVVADSFLDFLRPIVFEVWLQRTSATSSGTIFELSDGADGGVAAALADADLIFAAGALAGTDTGVDVTTVDALPLVAVKGVGTLTLTGNAVDLETVTIDGVVYTWVDTLVSAFDVLIGATASDSLDNLIAAINGAAGAGTTYGTGTTAHPRVDAAAGAGDTMTATATSFGSGGNGIGTSTVMADGSWATTHLTGGRDSILKLAFAIIPNLGLVNTYVNGQRAGSGVSEDGNFGAGGWGTAAGEGAVGAEEGTVTDRVPGGALTGALVVSPLWVYNGQFPRGMLRAGLGTNAGFGSWSNIYALNT